jgi:uncharacterized membrane protein YcaP (DUF421 family)
MTPPPTWRSRCPPPFRITGSKRLQVKDGMNVEGEARKELISEEEVRMLLRNQSIEDPSVVRRAYLEPDGNLSVFRNDGG